MERSIGRCNPRPRWKEAWRQVYADCVGLCRGKQPGAYGADVVFQKPSGAVIAIEHPHRAVMVATEQYRADGILVR